jgi:MEMO1 family protein
MMTVREPAVAGTFYPSAREDLAAAVARFLAAHTYTGVRPKALIVPHAGFIYSGAIAAAGFARLAVAPPERVILVGPAHRVYCARPAWPGVDAMRTPLGDVAIDREAIGALGDRVVVDPRAHAREHCLEVELPFIQTIAPQARIVPLLVSERAGVAALLAALWGGPETVIVISSDLSHYHPYAKARAIDRRTADKILAHDPALADGEACGGVAIAGLLEHARDLRVELVDLRSSGDTAGSKDEVVGYGAFALYE